MSDYGRNIYRRNGKEISRKEFFNPTDDDSGWFIVILCVVVFLIIITFIAV